MTRALFIVLFGLIVPAVALPQPQSDLEKEGLRGAVRIVRAESSQSNPGVASAAPVKRSLDSLTFDQKGNLIERVIYDDYGFLAGTEKYFPSANGNLTTAELVDEKRRLQEQRALVYKEGKLREISTYDLGGRLTSKEVHTYDARGGPAEQSHYNGQNLVGKTVFKTDSQSRVIEALYFLANGPKAIAPLGPCYGAHRVVYSYDKNGKVAEFVAYEPGGETKRKSTYRYDDHGNVLIELRESGSSTIVYTHQYVYDSHGNWVKDSIKIDVRYRPIGDKEDKSVIDQVINRQITYY